MADRLADAALAQLLSAARTYRAWHDKDVPDALLEDLTRLVQWGPTASNTLPARFVYVKSAAAKARLKPHLSEGNVAKTMAAPVVAVIGFDLSFFEHPPKGQDPAKGFADKPDDARMAAFRNGSLQGGYFILAARALGLDAGPMSGFDNEGVDREFFAGSNIKSNFLCNIGYGDGSGLRPRGPRLAFDEVARIL